MRSGTRYGWGESLELWHLQGLFLGAFLFFDQLDLADRLVRRRVDALLHQLLLQAGVPEVLYLVVSSSGQLRRNLSPPVHHSAHIPEEFIQEGN